jgi:hypothetical protein
MFSKKRTLTCNPYIDKLYTCDGDTGHARLDENKKRIHMVFKTQGEAAGLKALLTGPSGEKLTYTESREMYG